jgi:hypothetical protein
MYAVTGYGLDGPEIESWWKRKFFEPVKTDPGAHTASYAMGTGFNIFASVHLCTVK